MANREKVSCRAYLVVGVVIAAVVSPLPSVGGRILPKSGDYGVVYQEVPQDMTDALNSYLDLVMLKFNSEATQKHLEPYVSIVSFPEPGFLRDVLIHGLGQWQRVGDVQVLRQWNTGRMVDVHVRTTVVMEVPKFHDHHHHVHNNDNNNNQLRSRRQVDNAASPDGERAVVPEGDHDHDHHHHHHHSHVLDVHNETPGEPQASVTRTLNAVFRLHQMITRSEGNNFRTESLFLQPEDDAAVQLSEPVSQSAGSYDKLVSQFAEFENARALRNPYLRQALVRAMDDVLQTSGLRMGGLVEGARGSGSTSPSLQAAIAEGIKIPAGPQTDVQKFPAADEVTGASAAAAADDGVQASVIEAVNTVLENFPSATFDNDDDGDADLNLFERNGQQQQQQVAAAAAAAQQQAPVPSSDPAAAPEDVGGQQQSSTTAKVAIPAQAPSDVDPATANKGGGEETPTAKRRRILFV